VFSKRGLDYLAGVLLVAMVATVVAGIATDPISADTFREDARGVLADIVKDRDLFIVSQAFFLASSFISIVMAAGLYVVFRSHDRTLALIGSFGFLAGAVLMLTTNMVGISLISLAEDYAGTQSESLLSVASAVGLMKDVAFAMGAVGIAMGVLSYGLLILTTNAIPRWMGIFGIAGGIVTPFGWLLFVDSDLALIVFVGLSISLFFALISGGWLVYRGASEANN